MPDKPKTLPAPPQVHPDYKAVVPPTPGFYLIRHGGQKGVTVVNLRDDGRVEVLGESDHIPAERLVNMPTFPYEFGPRVVLGSENGRETIKLEAW